MWKRICLVEWLKERGIFLSRSLLLVCLQFRITPIGEWTGFSICANDTNRPIDLARPSGVKRRCSFPSLHCTFAGATCATHDMQLPMVYQSTAIQGSLPFVRLPKSPLFFFLVGYAILKDFSYLFGAKFTGQKFYRWRHDVMGILRNRIIWTHVEVDLLDFLRKITREATVK